MSAANIRWAAIGAAVAVTLGGGGLFTAAAVSSGERPVYVALDAPCRVADTRPGTDNVGTRDTPVGAGAANVHTITVRGENGNCTGSLAIPDDALAVSLNVTAVNPTTRSHFRVYPADVAEIPVTSNLNFSVDRWPVANKVDVALSSDGRITIFNAAGTADVAIDVFGYYVDHDHDDRYYDADRPIVVGQGIDWVTNAGNPSTVEIYETTVEIDGGPSGGTAQLSLIGPGTIGGREHRLVSVEYCVHPTLVDSDGAVGEASIIGGGTLLPGDPFSDSAEAKDPTDRTEPGCYTVEATEEVAARSTHHLQLFVVDSVSLGRVTATWAPG